MLVVTVLFVEVGKYWVYSADLQVCHIIAVTKYSVQSCVSCNTSCRHIVIHC